MPRVSLRALVAGGKLREGISSCNIKKTPQKKPSEGDRLRKLDLFRQFTFQCNFIFCGAVEVVRLPSSANRPCMTSYTLRVYSLGSAA